MAVTLEDLRERPVITLVLFSIVLVVVKNAYDSIRSSQRAKSLGCLPGVYGPSGPFGLGFFMKAAKAAKEGTRIELHDSLYKIHGNTFKQKIPGNEILFTIEPENAKAILTSQFADFGLGHRAKTMWPLLGDGIFNADGHTWSHARTLLRPQFTKDQVADLQLMDEHIKTFIEAIPKDKSLFDIQPLFFAFTNNSSTHFLFGESLAGPETSSGSGAVQFGRAFDKSLEWLSRRVSAQKLSFLVDGNKEYTSACKYVHDIADHYVRLALESSGEAKKSDRYIFLQALAEDTRDPKVLRDNILNLLIAGRDTTASLLSSVLFYLSHAPDVWKQLRREILDEFGDLAHPTGEITHAKIKNLRYLRYVLNEALRLLPPVPINSRMSFRDTSLPLGGGPDGKSRVFVKKGTVIPFSLYTMHRRKDIWGADAEEFNPERWATGGSHTWEYIPFNGGPRICLGQQYALIEASYMIIRLVQNFDTLENDGGSRVPDAKVDLTLTHRNGVNVRLYSNVVSSIEAEARKKWPQLRPEQKKKQGTRNHTTPIRSPATGAMGKHDDVVARISRLVSQFHKLNQPYRIFHGSTNSTRPRPNAQNQKFVDISALNNVLHVDRQSKKAHVEPNVPMDRLVEATLKHGLIPPVVMEFPGITAGGGYSGTSGESASFRHGFFDRTIDAVEMVLPNGEVVRTSEQNKPDLFRGAAGAVGSLGVTTLIELNLIEAKKFVKVTYERKNSVAAAVEAFQRESADPENAPFDYIDGIQFSPNHGVVIKGEMTDEKPPDAPAQTFSNPWDPWFYLHAQELTKTSDVATEYVPLAEYLFRYDRGGFWVGESAFKYFKFPFNKFTRWFLDDFLHTRMLYKALHASGESSRYVVQDLALPYENAEAFVDYTTQKFDIWPLWYCPLKQSPMPTMHPHNTQTPYEGRMLNIGLWGFGPAQPSQFVAKNRDLEQKLDQLGGMKWLYAHTYSPEDEFWKAFDREWYTALRDKYSATSLPSVWHKVKVSPASEHRTLSQKITSVSPLGGLWGIWKAIQSKEYMKHRKATWRTRN